MTANGKTLETAEAWANQTGVMVGASQLAEGRRLMSALALEVRGANRLHARLADLKQRLDPESVHSDLVEWAEVYMAGLLLKIDDAQHAVNILSLHPNPDVRAALESALSVARAWVNLKESQES